MSETPIDESVPGAPDPGVLYGRYKGLFLYIAGKRFRIPSAEAEALAHDVFLTYLRRPREIRVLRAWLVGAIVHASQAWWRDRRRHERLPPDVDTWVDERTEDVVERVAHEISLREVILQMPERCQQILTFRYFEGLSMAEIGKALDTTTDYAQKLVLGCMSRFRELYKKLAGETR